MYKFETIEEYDNMNRDIPEDNFEDNSWDVSEEVLEDNWYDN